MVIVDWNPPDLVPDVAEGSEELFWIAVDSKRAGGTIVLLERYQNRPAEVGEDGEPLNDDYLIDPDGNPIDSVRWVYRTEHEDFDGYYTPIRFDKDFVLLGWAKYATPEFVQPGEDMAIPTKIKSRVVRDLRFPTVLRRMWSGGDVQDWLNSQADELEGKYDQATS